MPLLKNDIISTFRNAVVYAEAGMDVQIISDHGEVLVVEDENKNRFAVCKNELIHERTESVPIKIIISEPLPSPTKTKQSRPRAAKQSAPEQSTLF